MTSERGSAQAIGLAMPKLVQRRVAQRVEHPVGRASASARVVPFGRRNGAHRGSAPDAADLGVLPREIFLGQLRREMRRADRSRAPLSLVLYRLVKGTEEPRAAAFRALLSTSIRETDVMGQLDAGTLAVICTDTGEEGVQRFIEKIDARSDGLAYSVESATYPSHLFEDLMQEPTAAYGPSPLLACVGDPSPGRDTYWLKRPVDIIGALLLLALFAPVMLAAALAIKLTSRGPVIFRQTRPGRHGRPFVFYKFRSMTTDNDDRIHRDYVAKLIRGENDGIGSHDGSRDGLVYKLRTDPRVTPVGAILRRTSIDELPQLFNVLKGDMSLVGPRPPLPYEAENYQSWHLRRVLDIRPGITGLWQVEGRSRVPFDEMVRMDLRYIRSCSLGLDLRIMAKTVLAVLSCKGAA